MLKLSWMLNDSNYELLSYDIISMNYFYNQDLKTASIFHKKFVDGEVMDKSIYFFLLNKYTKKLDSVARNIGK